MSGSTGGSAGHGRIPMRDPEHRIITYRHPWLDDVIYVVCHTVEYTFDRYDTVEAYGKQARVAKWTTREYVRYGLVCEECDAEGRSTCSTCHGEGEHECPSCDSVHECGECDGTGYFECEACKGTGIGKELDDLDLETLPEEVRRGLGVVIRREFPDPNQLTLFEKVEPKGSAA